MSTQAFDPDYSLGPEPEPGSYDPLQVHIIKSDIPLTPARRRKVSKFRTIILSAADPAQQLLITNHDRCTAYIVVYDNPVVLAKSQGDAQAAANTGDITLANPQGAIVPNTAINAMRNPYEIPGTNEVWVSAAAYPTRVSLQVVDYVTG